MIFQRDLPKILEGPSLALFSLSIMTIWKSIGYMLLSFLLDFKTFQNIIMNLQNRWCKWMADIQAHNFTITFTNNILCFYYDNHNKFSGFAPVWMMTGPPAGGPLGTTNVIVYYLYDMASIMGNMVM